MTVPERTCARVDTTLKEYLRIKRSVAATGSFHGG
jgi:hypothetical protein